VIKYIDKESAVFSEKVIENLKNSSAIRAMFEEGAKLKNLYGAGNVFDFSLGNPDPDPPAETLEALKKLVLGPAKGLHGYMSNAGYPEVREKIAARLNRDCGGGLGFENIIMT
jgi:aspartate aminotransferase